MRRTDLHAHLFTTNATVLLAHQVDAAYWREWEMFGIPGGIQVFVLLNLPIVALVLHGVRAIALGRPSGVRLSWLLVASGLFAAVFHSVHLRSGDDAFRTEVSVGLLVGTAVLSVLQAVVLVRSRLTLERTPGALAG